MGIASYQRRRQQFAGLTGNEAICQERWAVVLIKRLNIEHRTLNIE
ncbi:MAG: hypothetical protein HGJ94_13225 [Desulfosarcina sp.]|nr:hypothetical protein [Desulfosarcina sp.]